MRGTKIFLRVVTVAFAVLLLLTGLDVASAGATQTSKGADREAITSAPEIFTVTPIPTITGTAAVGSTLAANSGTWGPTPDRFAYQWMSARSSTPLAVSPTYTPLQADAGSRLWVRVMAVKAGFASITKSSTNTSEVQGTIFGSTPVITGNPFVGSTLSVQPGAWGPGNVSFQYAWFRNGVAVTVGGPSYYSSTYKLTSADTGATMTVQLVGRATASPPLSKTSLATAQVQAYPYTTAPAPTITGVAAVGSTLTANSGTWDPTPDAYTYQWMSGRSATPLAVTPTYTLTLADAGSVLWVRVTASKSGLPATTKSSLNTAVVQSTFYGSTPIVTGQLFVGSTLSVQSGSWGPGNVSFQYAWFRNGLAVTVGGPSYYASTYKLTSADTGATITVQLVGHTNGSPNLSKLSPPTAPIRAYPYTTTPVPTIIGTSAVGSTLTANTGTWDPAPDSFTYQWMSSTRRDGSGSPIPTGVTTRTYTVQPADAGGKIWVRVTAVKAGLPATTKSSLNTATITVSLSTPPPVIKGTMKAGSTLSVDVSAWGPVPFGFYTTWFRDGTKVQGLSFGLTSYSLGIADVGSTFTVQITGTWAGGTAVNTSSSTTAVVGYSFTSTPQPTISGVAIEGSRLVIDPGPWAPGPVNLSYRWYRGSAQIVGAKSSTYTLTADDVGHRIGAIATATKKGYVTTTTGSKSTAIVLPPSE